MVKKKKETKNKGKTIAQFLSHHSFLSNSTQKKNGHVYIMHEKEYNGKETVQTPPNQHFPFFFKCASQPKKKKYLKKKLTVTIEWRKQVKSKNRGEGERH